MWRSGLRHQYGLPSCALRTRSPVPSVSVCDDEGNDSAWKTGDVERETERDKRRRETKDRERWGKTKWRDRE